MKKRTESIYSAVDIGFNSLISFTTFLYIKDVYGIDILGFFGLLLSVASFVEVIQMGLYERPAYLGFSVGYKKFKLKIYHLFGLIVFPLLVINQLIISGYIISSVLFCIAYVLIQNIRVFDYINHDIKRVSIRSFLIFVMTGSLYGYLILNNLKVDLNIIFFAIASFRFLFIIFERKKIFAIDFTDENQEIGFLISQLLVLIRSRLPLWALLPYGLGLVGIYEAFRTLLEIYLVPSRPIFLVMLKNLRRDGPKRIFNFGILFASITVIMILISFYTITSSSFFDIKEISTPIAFISLVLIAVFFWLSEITGMIFQFNSEVTFEAIRRGVSIFIFVLTSLIFYNFLSFNIFLFLISLMYFSEVAISFYSRKRLQLK